MSHSNATNLLQQAISEYETENLNSAYYHAKEAYALLSSERTIDTLNAATLLQTTCAYLQKCEECIALEQPIYDLILNLFPQNNISLYIMHLSDFSSQLFYMHQTNMYKNAISTCLSLIKSICNDSHIIDFYENFYSAHIAYLEENYHASLYASSIANENWIYESLNDMGKANLLLMCSCNAKLNNPETSINFLETELKNSTFSIKEQLSAHSILAELYLRTNRIDLAKQLYQQLINNPLYMKSLSCNAAENSYYNYALALITEGNYEQAEIMLSKALPKAYPILCSVYAALDNDQSIHNINNIFSACCTYLDREISHIKSHYREDLAYSHLSLLQYQIDFALHSFLYTKESPSNELSFSVADLYTFLLKTKYISLDFASQQEKDINATTIMNSLDSNTLLLEFSKTHTFSKSIYHVFLISNKNISCINLGNCVDIDTPIIDMLDLISSIPSNSEELSLLPQYRHARNTLRKLLYLPLQETIRNYSRLIIAPAGNLINFPFTLLPISSQKNLGEEHTILYCNTGKELIGRLSKPTTPLQKPFIIGAPDYIQYPPLKHAKKECMFISDLYHIPPLLGNDANVKNILSCDFKEYDSLHIATHGIYAPDLNTRDTSAKLGAELTWHQLEESMKNTGIVLSQDSLLDCKKIAKLPLSNIHLATISCCHSGQCTYQNTEGAYGMRRAFLTAGCNTLLVSLWSVDDEASVLFMNHFHQQLKNTPSYELAFNSAINFLKNFEVDGYTPYCSPFYWAGYELIL